MAYCEVNDLLVRDNGMMFSPTFDFVRFINSASEEMDGMLGEIYSLPLASAAGGWKTLPVYQQLLLKQINIKLASGRILLTLQASGDTRSLHAYGQRLLDEAMAMLMPLINGTVRLDTPARDAVALQTSPVIQNHDSRSLVDIFENVVHRGEDDIAVPGNASTPTVTFQYETPSVILPPQEIPIPPFAVMVITADYQATLSDRYIDADATGGPITVTLPTAVGHLGRDYIIKRVNAGSNDVVVDALNVETIDGQVTYTLIDQWESVTIISDNSNWKVI